jgi:hypothetical protein
MIRRKKKNSSLWLYITSIIIILWIIWLYFSWILTINITPINNNSSTWNIINTENWKNNSNKIYTNSIISWNITIQKIPYDINVWTNYKTTFKNKEMYLKSDKYDLDSYKNIYFKWEIIWFSADNIPVLNITYISENWENNNTKNITWDNQTKTEENKYYSDNWIIIDLQETKLQVKNLSWNITIYKTEIWDLLNWETLSWDINTWDNTITTNIGQISYFECQKWNSIYDCWELKKQYKLYKFTTIVNNNWVVFYKLPETNQYSILWENYWYNLIPISWDIYRYINNISLINTKDLKIKLIKNTCQNQNYSLTTILNISNSWDNYVVDGFDNKSNKLICKLNINWTNILIWKLQSLELTQKEIKSEKIDESKYLTYKSRAFSYTLYMPKYIKYKAKISKEDFWVSWLNCKQVVNIADWKTWNLNSPDVQVYYCKTDLSKDNLNEFLKRKQFSYIIKQINGKTFIITYKPWIIWEKIVSNIKIF